MIVIVDELLKKFTKIFALPPLAVGIGIYLPPSLQTPLIIGAVLSYILERKTKTVEELEAGKKRGTLFASGLIVAESLIGVIIAGIVAVSVSSGGSETPFALVGADFQGTADILGLAAFVAVLGIFYKIVKQN